MIITNYPEKANWDQHIKVRYSLFLDTEEVMYASCAYLEDQLEADVWSHREVMWWHITQDESIKVIRVQDLIKGDQLSHNQIKKLLFLIANGPVYQV